MRFSIVIDWLSRKRNLWIAVFIYTIMTGLFVQLILLPSIVPSWHDGNGLLVGIDGSKFHRIALNLYNAIEEQGWGQWVLRPEGQLVSGIAAVFYKLIYPLPLSVLPLNSFLNASASVLLYLITFGITKDRKASLISVMPFSHSW